MAQALVSFVFIEMTMVTRVSFVREPEKAAGVPESPNGTNAVLRCHDPVQLFFFFLYCL
jgi:hypothetical protein